MRAGDDHKFIPTGFHTPVQGIAKCEIFRVDMDHLHRELAGDLHGPIRRSGINQDDLHILYCLGKDALQQLSGYGFPRYMRG